VLQFYMGKNTPERRDYIMGICLLRDLRPRHSGDGGWSQAGAAAHPVVLHENDDGRFTKVANIVGHSMQYHPHGDASIADALVNLTNKQYLIEGQGNFGNPLHGRPRRRQPLYRMPLTPWRARRSSMMI
jgi:hypothetical protein